MLAGLYLAAGENKRTGKPRACDELSAGVSLGSAGLRTLLACGLDRLAVVVRFGDPLHWLLPEQRMLAITGKLAIVPCPDAPLGIAHALKRGVRALLPSSPGAILVTLADQPFITPELIGDLRRTYMTSPAPDYAACVGGDSPILPAILSAKMFVGISRLEGDADLQTLLQASAGKGKLLKVASPELLTDVVNRNVWQWPGHSGSERRDEGVK